MKSEEILKRGLVSGVCIRFGRSEETGGDTKHVHAFEFSPFLITFSLISWNSIENAAENETTCAKAKRRLRLRVWIIPEGTQVFRAALVGHRAGGRSPFPDEPSEGDCTCMVGWDPHQIRLSAAVPCTYPHRSG